MNTRLQTLLACFLIIGCLMGQSTAVSHQPYVILISLDGFRWDYVNRGITPNFDYIREHGVSALSLEPVFPTKTFPNHLSLITGMYAENHGIIFNHFTDPYTGERYTLADTASIRKGRWYLGEAFWETAERQGITCASYFWPGAEVHTPHRHPTYREFYEHRRPYEKRIRGVLDWLKLPEARRPHFITLYFDEPDTRGHRFGPNSPEVNRVISRLDSLLGMLINGLRDMHMLEKVNLIVVSDHGMTEVDTFRIVNVERQLQGFACRYTGDGPVLTVRPEEAQLEAVYARLKKSARHYRVYRREEVPDYYHFSHHPFIDPLVLVAEPGWSLHSNASLARLRRRHPAATGGNHGYDNHFLDMHGIFYAMGPAFKQGYRTGTLRNIDVYPLLCKIFHIMPRQNIDGKLERIAFILREDWLN